MCSLSFLLIVFVFMYRTSGKNIQILVILDLKIFSDFCYTGAMGILDNLEAYLENEPDNLAVKLFSDMCCENCSCKED